MEHQLLIILVLAGLGLLSLGYFFRLQLFDLAMTCEARLASLKEYTMTLNGLKVCYLDNHLADKPSLVLLHGFSANKENWLRFAKHLKHSFRIIAIDLAGHGKSHQDESIRYDLDDQAAFVEELLSALKIDKFHLAGNSMGGGISILLGSRNPNRVLSMTLFNPAGIYRAKSELDDRLAQGKNPLIVENFADFQEVMRFTMSRPPYFPYLLKLAAAEVYAANSALKHKIWRDFFVGDQHSYSLVESLEKLLCPVLVVWGEEDRVLNHRNSSGFLDSLQRGSLQVLPGIGHLPMLEVPKFAATSLQQFVSKEGV